MNCRQCLRKLKHTNGNGHCSRCAEKCRERQAQTRIANVVKDVAWLARAEVIRRRIEDVV